MSDQFDLYVCPKCRGRLHRETDGLLCSGCKKRFPITDGIPDFLLLNPEESTNPFLHGFGKILAPIYESPFWFPIMLRLLAGWKAPTLRSVVESVCQKIDSIRGCVLDVATGTGTYGRHIANRERRVYGIDISWEMLKKGQQFVDHERITNMYFGRADAESLPFEDRAFDGCLFCGSLHIFPDTKKILTEVGRTMKCGSPLVVTTIIHGDKGILRDRGLRTRKPRRFRVFELSELEEAVAATDFSDFEPDVHGSVILFTAKKK